MQRLHEEYFASTLQSVEKPTTGGCLVVASRFGQPEIQSTLKFVYGRKRARAKRRRGRRAEGEGEGRGGMDGGKRAETFRGRRSMHGIEEWKMAGGSSFKNVRAIFPGTSFWCPTTIMRKRHNGDRDRHGYCPRTVPPRGNRPIFVPRSIYPAILFILREGKFADTLFVLC